MLRAAGSPLPAAGVRAGPGGGLACTTVVTILARPRGKGILRRRKDGPSFRCRPTGDQAGLAARRLARVPGAGPDREKVLARFVSGLPDTGGELLRQVLCGGTTPGRW